MNEQRVEELEALLAQTETAHGAFERAELDGVYDKEWPRWYAAYAVEHGIASILGHAVSADRLTAFLADSWADFERSDPRPPDPWVTWTARRVAAEL